MSEDIFQDRSKFSKKRGGGVGGNNGPPNDYKQPRKNHNRDYPVYDSKGYDKPPRDQNGPGKGSYSPAYDEYGSKPPRNDNYQPYKGKPHNSKQRIPNVWRKKTNKISKESILESFPRVKPHKDIDEWIKEHKELFVKEPQPPVNDQVFQFDPNEAIVTKTSRPPPSGGPQKETENQPSAPETGKNDTKGLQMFDFAQERHDPIMEMRKKKVGGDKPEKKSGQKEQQFDELLEDESAMKGLGGHQKFGGGLEGELGGKDEELGGAEKDYGLDNDDEEKFSDVDARFEKKLKNHEIQEVYEDAFDDLLEPTDKRGQLEMMANAERPEWESVDTNQVIEDIKREDFLSSLPQDKGAIFGKDYVKREPRRQEQNHFDEQHDSRFNNNFDFDFSKIGFHDPKGADDFPLKGIDDDDLFQSTFNQGVQQKSNLFGAQEGNPSSQVYFSDPMMQQQGNMARLAQQQNPNMMNNNLPSFFQFQQMQQQMPHMPNMMQMPRNPQQMQQMNQMNPMEIMQKMGVKYPTPGNPNFIPPIKPNPQQQQRDMPVAGFPRQQLNPTYPSFIFKYFSPNYDDKLWYYIDLQKIMQGPFSGKIMDEWYANGHLPLTLHVTIGKGNTFKTLKELADLIVNRTLGDDYPSGGQQQNSEGRHFEPLQQGFSGVADLLKNRPDLAQFGANTQAPTGSKAKGLDEVEKFGGPLPHQREQNFPENYGGGGGGNYYYHQKGGQNGPNHGEFGNQYQNYQKNAMKKGGYPMGGQGGYDYNARDQIGVDSPNKNQEGQNINKMMSQNPSLASSTLSGSTDFSAKNKSQNEKPQQDQGNKEAQKTEEGKGEPLQTVNDMTNHLKNILGLSLGGGMLNLGGLIAPETANTRIISPVVEPNLNQQQQQQQQQPQKVVERPQPTQQQQQQQNERFYHQAHNHHYHHHEKQEKPEKQLQSQQQQQQPQGQNQTQRKGSKAPKIDTADFPSLGEAYK